MLFLEIPHCQSPEWLAQFGSPSLEAVPHLLVGKDDSESDQIKFRLSDCEFAYVDFRDEEAAALKLKDFWSSGRRRGTRCPFSK